MEIYRMEDFWSSDQTRRGIWIYLNIMLCTVLSGVSLALDGTGGVS
jgi:hypothetical protein